MSRPLVIIVIIFMAGIFLSRFWPYSAGAAFVGAIAVFGLALIGYFKAWRNNRLVIFLFFLILGVALGRLAVEGSQTALVDYAGHYVTVTGTVVREPDVRPDKTYLVVKCREVETGLGRESVDGLVQVRVPVGAFPENVSSQTVGAEARIDSSGKAVGAAAQQDRSGYVYDKRNFRFQYGDIVKAKGLLAIPDEPGNPGQFNYREYLLRRGIRVQMFVDKVSDISVVGRLAYGINPGSRNGRFIPLSLVSGPVDGLVNSTNGRESGISSGFGTDRSMLRNLMDGLIDGFARGVNPLTAMALHVKHVLTGVLDETLPIAHSSILKGIMFGERGLIDPEVKETFVEVGIVHLPRARRMDFM